MDNLKSPRSVPHGAWFAAPLAAAFLASAATAQTDIPPKAKDFVMAAAQSDHFEIEAGHDAITQSQNPRIRAFAQMMIEEHARTSANLAQAAAASGLEPPSPGMSSDQAAMLASIQSQRGPEFDRAYIKQQVLAHQQALAVEQSYASGGSVLDLQAAARATVPIIQHHLEMAQQIKAELGGS